jgi:hypothetical protein
MSRQSSGAGVPEKIYADPVIRDVHVVGWDAMGEAVVVEFEAVSPTGRASQRHLVLHAAAAQALLLLLGQALEGRDTEELPRQ